jgi:hypothetical protein
MAYPLRRNDSGTDTSCASPRQNERKSETLVDGSNVGPMATFSCVRCFIQSEQEQCIPRCACILRLTISNHPISKRPFLGRAAYRMALSAAPACRVRLPLGNDDDGFRIDPEGHCGGSPFIGFSQQRLRSEPRKEVSGHAANARARLLKHIERGSCEPNRQRLAATLARLLG